jgi:hypothetical protein
MKRGPRQWAAKKKKPIVKKSRYPACIFCQKDDSEPSKEDVLPKWMARQFPNKKKSRFTGLTGTFGDSEWPTKEIDTVGRFGWEAEGPCRQCNNGWMSRLENETRPILRPLMHGEDCHLNSSQVLTLAQWALKTAIMSERLQDEFPPFFTKRNRIDFFESRTIPPNTFIYAAHYLGEAATYNIGGPLEIVFPGTTKKGVGCSFTFAVGQLALQVFSLRPPQGFKGPLPLQVDVPARWENAHLPVWPVALAGWHWPSTPALDDRSFRDFATRMARKRRVC